MASNWEIQADMLFSRVGLKHATFTGKIFEGQVLTQNSVVAVLNHSVCSRRARISWQAPTAQRVPVISYHSCILPDFCTGTQVEVATALDALQQRLYSMLLDTY